MCEINRLDRDGDRLRSMINTSRISLEKLIRESNRFSEFDAKRIKDLLNHDFPTM